MLLRHPRCSSTGRLLQRMPSRLSSDTSPRLPSSPCLTHDSDLWSRWMPPMKESEQFPPKDQSRTAKCTHAPFCHGGCPGHTGIMTWATGSCWRLRSPWKSGDTGWRGLVIHLLSGQTIRILNTLKKSQAIQFSPAQVGALL